MFITHFIDDVHICSVLQQQLHDVGPSTALARQNSNDERSITKL